MLQADSRKSDRGGHHRDHHAGANRMALFGKGGCVGQCGEARNPRQRMMIPIQALDADRLQPDREERQMRARHREHGGVERRRRPANRRLTDAECGDLLFACHRTNCNSVDIVVIVTVTRTDLRDEIVMANEAFALSPMSARRPSRTSRISTRSAKPSWRARRPLVPRRIRQRTRMPTRAWCRRRRQNRRNPCRTAATRHRRRLPKALVAIRRAIADAESAAGKAFDPAALEASLSHRSRAACTWSRRSPGAGARSAPTGESPT